MCTRIRRWSCAGLLVAWSILVCGSVQGAVYYVSPTGTPQGDGSKAKPFSIGHVLTTLALQPGDEVVFLDGVYELAKTGALNIKSVGNEKAPIVYRAENRHKAILDGGTLVTGWTRVGNEPVWQAKLASAPVSLLVDGEGLLDASSSWRRDGKQTLEEGMFAADPPEGGTVLTKIHPWGGKEPKEVFSLMGNLVDIGGAYNIVDGFLIRRGRNGVHIAGRQVNTYKLEAGTYFDVCGLANNLSGSFNVLRNCIVRDMPGCALTSNESRFNLIEDNVIYNSGLGQGDHGIYISQGAENLTLRRNVWWRTSGGAIHIYSGSGTDSPRGIVVEYNIFGPDKRNRCFPLKNRKSAALYVWGGHRWAGHNRIVHNIVIGPNDRAVSMNSCNFNLIANNTFLGSDGAPIQVGSGFGNIIVNNIIEYSPGIQEQDSQAPAGYVFFAFDPKVATALSICTSNLLLPRGDQGREIPAFMQEAKLATADPFMDRAGFDFRLKPGSEAIGLGKPIPFVTDKPEGTAPDVGALELGQEMTGEKGKFPEIPKWLLEEWPLTKRGQ